MPNSNWDPRQLLRVALLEHDTADIELTMNELRRAGLNCEFQVADTPEKFRQLLALNHFDLVISDYSLPGWNASNAIEMLRAAGRMTPFILVTGTLGDESAVEFMKRGASDYIMKDHLERLPVAVKRAMDAETVRVQKEAAETALRRNHALLSAIVDGTPDAIYLKGADGRYQLMNAAGAALLQQPVKAVVGKCDAELLSSEDAARMAASDETVLSTGQTVHSEAVFPGLLNSPVLATINSPLRDSQGRIVGVIGVCRDVTDRRRADERIRRLNRVYSVLSAINELIIRSRNLPEIFGQSCRIAAEKGGFRLACVARPTASGKRVEIAARAGEAAGYADSIVIDLEDQESCRGPIATALLEGHPSIVNDIARDPRITASREAAAGHGLHSTAAFPLRRGGEVVAVLGLFASEPGFFDADEIRLLNELAADISFALDTMEHERRRLLAEEALLHSEERLRSLVEGLDAIVWECDATLQFTYVSPRAESMTGYPAAQWLGDPDFWAAHIHPDDRERAVNFYRSKTAALEDHQFEYRMITADRRTLWLRNIVRVVSGEPGEPARLRGVMVDVSERKRAEAAMRFMQFAVDHAMDGAAWVRRDGTFAYVNEAFCRMLGYEREALLAKKWPQITPPGSPVAWEQHWQKVGAAGGLTEEIELVRAGGERLPVELSVNRVEFEGAEFHCTFARDVSARRSSEQQLRLQSAALESAANAILFSDTEGTITWVNPAFTFLTGYPAADVIGRKTSILKSGRHSDDFYEDLWKTVLRGHAWFGHMINRRKDGSLYDEEMTITPVRDSAGKVTHFIAIKQDVTTRRAAEHALQRSEERYRAMVENASYGIFRTGPDGQILDANPALLAMLGCQSLDEARRTNVRQLYRSPEDCERIINQLLSADHVRGSELEWNGAGGKPMTVRLSGRAVRGQNGDSLHFECIAEDITERRALERALAASQKFEAIGKLAGGIAHDFNNVLGAILGWAELSESLAAADSKLVKNLRIIEEQARKGAGLTRQLLAFARRQHLESRVLDLNQSVAEVAALLEKVIGKDIELRTDLAPDLSTVRADPTQIEQVLMNLCVNARDALPHGGFLSLSTHNVEYGDDYRRNYPYVQPGRFVQIRVTDTGSGMDKSVLDHIFEPFFTTKEKGKGTGLGLATVYGIVKQHGGFIHVYSEVSRGTTFHINLPALEMPAEPAKKKEETAPVRGGSETILIAEDHLELGAMAQATLEGLGYSVLRCPDGQEAVKLFEQHLAQISLVFMDVVMPKLSGPEAYKRMCAHRADLPAVFASGYSADVPALSDLVATGKTILHKPYGMQEMARQIRSALDAAAARKD